jgi:hypothetical protein
MAAMTGRRTGKSFKKSLAAQQGAHARQHNKMKTVFMISPGTT